MAHNIHATTDRNIYGAIETNGLVHAKQYHEVDRSAHIVWTDKRLKAVTRLRLLSDPGLSFWDVSYCHGVLQDGTECHVVLPFSQLPKYGYKKAIVEHAKREGVYAKQLGILDAISRLL